MIFFELYAHPGAQMSLDQLLAVLITYGSALYAAACEIILVRYGKWITNLRGEKWAKELDYPYLFLGSLGLVVSLNRLDAIEGHWARVEIIGPLIVATAIVVRLVKTRVEIAGWNKKEFYNLPHSDPEPVQEPAVSVDQTVDKQEPEKPPPLTIAEVMEVMKDNFVAVSAAALLIGVGFAATFLAAYLSIFDWHLIWFVQYPDIITFGLFAVVVGSGSVSLIQGFAQGILAGETSRQRRNGAIAVGAALILFAVLGIGIQSYQGLGFQHILFGTTAIGSTLVLIIIVTRFVEYRAVPTLAQCLWMVLLLLLNAGTLGTWLGHSVKENADFKQDIFVKGEEIHDAKLVIVMSRHTILLKDGALSVVPTGDITKFQVAAKPNQPK